MKRSDKVPDRRQHRSKEEEATKMADKQSLVTLTAMKRDTLNPGTMVNSDVSPAESITGFVLVTAFLHHEVQRGTREL